MAAQTQARIHSLHDSPIFRLDAGHPGYPSRQDDATRPYHRPLQQALPLRPNHSATSAALRFPQNKRLSDASEEDMLRRKTPNGTLIGAYDGTSAGIEHLSRAAKHLVVSSQPNGLDRYFYHYPDARHNLQLRQHLRSQMYQALPALKTAPFDNRQRNMAPIDSGLTRSWPDGPPQRPPTVDSSMNAYHTLPPQMGAGHLGVNVMEPPMQQHFGPTASHDSAANPRYWPSFVAGVPLSQPGPPLLDANHLHHQHPGLHRHEPLLPAANAARAESFHPHQILGSLQNYSINDGPSQATFPPSTGLAPDSPFTRPDVNPDVLLRSAHQLYEQLLAAIAKVRRDGLLHELSNVALQVPKVELYPDAMRKELKLASRAHQKALTRQHLHNSRGATFAARDFERGGSSAAPKPQFDSVDINFTANQAYSPWLPPPPPPWERQRASFSQHLSRSHPGQPSDARSFMSCHIQSVLLPAAFNALAALDGLLFQSNLTWIDGLLMAGALSYVIGDFQAALKHFSTILEQEPDNMLACANSAVALLALERKDEAEAQWRHAIKLKPLYIPAVEHMVGLLCSERRHREAAHLIDYVEGTLRAPTLAEPKQTSNRNTSSLLDDLRNGSTFEPAPKHTMHFQGSALSQRYQVPPDENCRLLGLFHAKGNILYNLHDQRGAARAFEEVVLIAVGQVEGGIDRLTSTVNASLARAASDSWSSQPLIEKLLLSPEKALQTAKLCFPPNGHLPGLRDAFSSSAMKQAVNITSNSLLSLAKIFQDSMNPNVSSTVQDNRGVTDILALYYLSFALQPSPSTANNVGILLAGIQTSAAKKKEMVARGVADEPNFMFPGVVPGSGIALALMYYKYGLNLDSRHAHLYTNLGSLLKDIGQLHFAVHMYEKAVSCDGTFDIALANLANAVKDQGKVHDAIGYYKRAVAVNPNFAEAVCGLANALNSVCNWAGRGGVILAHGKLDRWHVGDNNELIDARVSRASSGWVQRVVEIVENQLKDGENWGRGILEDDQIRLLSDSIALHILDSASRSMLAQRVKSYLKRIVSTPWAGARLIRLIERAIRQIGWSRYHDRYVRGVERPAMDYARPNLPPGLSVSSAPTILPFHTFTFPMTARQIRLISQKNGLRVSTATLKSPWLPKTVYTPPPPPSPQLIVGYVSSDFNNHPLAHLMQSVFGFHDPSKVKAICYATTPSDNSIHRRHIESEAPLFHDVSSWPIERTISRIVADGCHILINLNGYTRGARNEIFAARPAPLQMSFMGFAGSLGAEWCDYLLTDEIASPPDTLRRHRSNVTLADLETDDNYTSVLLDDDHTDWVYQENVIYTRYTFFCCDHAQSSPPSPMPSSTSFEAELARRIHMRRTLFPDLAPTSLILANFNQLYKIDPSTFRTWLRILSRLPNAILWLLRFPDAGEAHLLRTARLWASEDVARRVRFTDVAAKSEHIRRACIADLFLDTPECNAHTTAADCLWSGTPLLTLRRYKWKMASRMAASILAGALGVPSDECERAQVEERGGRTAEHVRVWRELVARDEDEYEEMAVRLGRDLVYLPDAPPPPAHPSMPPPSAPPSAWYPPALGRPDPYALPRGATFAAGVCQGRLVEMRRMLWEGRFRAPLYDTRRWVRDLEAAYAECWTRWVQGRGGDVRLRELL